MGHRVKIHRKIFVCAVTAQGILTFHTPKPKKYYTLIFGKKVYITKENIHLYMKCEIYEEI